MSRFGKGALLMILSALGFSAMQIAIAKTAQGIPLFEQLFFRNLFACIAAFVSLRRKKSGSLWQAGKPRSAGVPLGGGLCGNDRTVLRFGPCRPGRRSHHQQNVALCGHGPGVPVPERKIHSLSGRSPWAGLWGSAAGVQPHLPVPLVPGGGGVPLGCVFGRGLYRHRRPEKQGAP